MDRKTILGSVGQSISGLFGRKSKAVVTAPPCLSSAARFPYGPFQFKFQIGKGLPYEIQASSNLQAWEPISSGTSAGEPVEYVDSDASKFNLRFYRVLLDTVCSNVIGYASINVPPGYSLIANPLHASSNAVSAILPDMPEDTALNKFDTHLIKLTENTVKNDKWINPEWDSNPPILGVGESFWIGKTTPGNWVQTLVIKQRP